MTAVAVGLVVQYVCQLLRAGRHCQLLPKL